MPTTETATEVLVAPGDPIQSALDSGAPTVRLAEGVHTGGFVLRDGVRVVGAGAGKTVIVPGEVQTSDVPPLHDAPEKVDHGIVAHRVTGASVEGLTLRGFSGAGVYAHTATDLRLTDVEADGNRVWGIYLRESSGLAVHRCRAAGSQYGGIALAFCRAAEADIDDCETTANAFGVFVDNSSRARVRRVRSHGNAAGILMLHQTYPGEPEGGVTDCLVADCDLTGNSLAAGGEDPEALGAAGPPMSGVGLAMIGVQRVAVVGNRITGNHPGGPSVMGAALVVGSSADWGGSASTDNTLEWNTVTGNSPANAWVDPDGQRLVNNEIGEAT
ncbi:right-handed parallel beta-helix repeat-containing protein [Actinokineospora soli]|uniref:Right-handed parallel beta-helix repeat-containing protein n=1 Tax=Actinokineospora soli TaxID=1048753 RepID=A0ABW2TIB1_9PSEU